MVTVARLESGICNPGLEFAPASVHLVFFDLMQRIKNWIALGGETGT